MGVLSDLPGVKEKEIECAFIEKAEDIKDIFARGMSATSAGPNGAINIWKDDEGYYQCQAMRYLKTIDKKIYSRISSAISWTKKWLKEIE